MPATRVSDPAVKEIILNTSSIAKLPPQNIEAEQSLLGALLIDKEAIINIAEALHPVHFYRTEQHGQIYEAILELFEKREPIDLITVTEQLKAKGVIDKVGGSAYLTDLINKVPTAAHVEFYAKIIKEHAIRRSLIASSTRFVEQGYDESIDINQIIENCEQSIFALSQQHIKRDFIPIKDALAQSFDRLDELQKSSGKLRGVPTGFRDLDNKLAGLQDSNLIIFAARPGAGKCLAFDSLIVNPETGERMTIEEYYHQKTSHILTLQDSLKMSRTQVSQFVDDGIRPVYRVITATGREIEVTASHPFLTISGWKKLSEIKVGESLATPRQIPVFGKCELEDFKVKAIAYFLSDGGLTGSCPRFTNVNPVIVKDFLSSMASFGNVAVHKYDSQGKRAASYEVVKKIDDKVSIRTNFAKAMQSNFLTKNRTQYGLASDLSVSPATVSMWMNGISLPSEDKVLLIANYFNQSREIFLPRNFYGFSAKNSVTGFLSDLSLMGKNALEKEIPGVIFTLTKPKLILFLNRIFACDGSAYITPRGPVISYSSSSKPLISGMQHLLLRFGILSKVRKKRIKYKGTIRESFELEVSDSHEIVKFCETIGIFAKETKVTQVYELAKQRVNQNNYSRDSIPLEIWDHILRIKGNLSWREVYRRMGLPISHNIHVGKRHLKRSTLRKIAVVLQSEQLRQVAESDIFWDKIIAIQPVGLKQVYDLTIPQTHNFVANDLFVHNTSFVLNVAAHIAVNTGLPVGFFSLEMSQEELVDRLLVSQADIDAWKLKTGKLDDKDFDRLSHAMGQLADAPLYIDDTPGATLSEIRTKARRLQIEHGLKLVIIDYLQLINVNTYADNRVQQVSEISKGLKNLARELKVPVFALSQLSRAVEARGTRKPQLSDLRESGSIEQDADVVMFIYKEDPENIEDVTLDIQKHRNGPTGEIKLIFRGDRVKFYGMERHRSMTKPAASKENAKAASS